MARVTPQQFADKWNRRIKAATPDIQSGIQRVTEAPGMKAAANVNAMKTNLNASIDSGVWARRTAGVSLQDWQAAALNKGVSRIAAGADGAQQKMVSVGTDLLAAVDATLAEIAPLKRGTLEDNINRMNAWARGMNKRRIRRTAR